jgi:hypothetical protein
MLRHACCNLANARADLVVPAVQGTVGILESIKNHACAAFPYSRSTAPHTSPPRSPTVKRVIVLSSTAAVLQQTTSPVTYDETSWNEPSVAEVREKGAAASPFAAYRASKTLAERAAWEFVKKNKGAIGWDLVVLNPPFVWGVRRTTSFQSCLLR